MSKQHPTKPGLRVVDAKFFAQVEATKVGTRFDSKSSGTVPEVQGARVVSITQSRPAKPKSGCVVVELTLRVPEGVFLPLQPAAIIDLPDTLVQAGTLIEVEADDGNGMAVAQSWAQANKLVT